MSDYFSTSGMNNYWAANADADRRRAQAAQAEAESEKVNEACARIDAEMAKRRAEGEKDLAVSGKLAADLMASASESEALKEKFLRIAAETRLESEKIATASAKKGEEAAKKWQELAEKRQEVAEKVRGNVEMRMGIAEFRQKDAENVCDRAVLALKKRQEKINYLENVLASNVEEVIKLRQEATKGAEGICSERDFYKGLLCLPMKDIAEKNGDFKKTYEEQQYAMAMWILNSSAYAETAMKLGLSSGKTKEEVDDAYKESVSAVLANKTKYGHDAKDSDVLRENMDKILKNGTR